MVHLDYPPVRPAQAARNTHLPQGNQRFIRPPEPAVPGTPPRPRPRRGPTGHRRISARQPRAETPPHLGRRSPNTLARLVRNCGFSRPSGLPSRSGGHPKEGQCPNHTRNHATRTNLEFSPRRAQLVNGRATGPRPPPPNQAIPFWPHPRRWPPDPVGVQWSYSVNAH